MKKYILILALLCASFAGYAQKEKLTQCDSVALRAMQVGMVLVPERVYMQFDNSAYFLGETIWFKAYVTSGNDNRPTDISKVLYVELVAPEGYVVKTEKYKIDEAGVCVGEFYMDPLYLSGYFEVRAYTRYMLNWGASAVFSRVFPVFDKVNGNNWEFKNMLDRRRAFGRNGKWVREDDANEVLTFYPEGGHLVNGLLSRVAFEVRGVRGVERYDTITVYADGKPLLKSAPVHMGKGVFELTPEKGVEYFAEVYVENEKGKMRKHKVELPAVAENGAAVRVDEIGDSVRIIIQRNRCKEGIGLVVVHRSTICHYSISGKKEENDTLSLPLNSLPEGVCRAVLFTGNRPLAERIFFVEHTKRNNSDAKPVKLNVSANGSPLNEVETTPYGKVSIIVEREDSLPIGEDAEFSLAVVDRAGKINTSWGWNIYTYMLLGSEIKGYIPDASQYFDHKNKERKKQLDLVMLTNGWTAYEWKKMSAPSLSGLQEAEKEITLRGTFYRRLIKTNPIFGTKTQQTKPQPYNLIRLDVPYNPDTIKTSTFRTDEKGSFMLGLRDFYGKRVVALSPRTAIRHSGSSRYQVVLDRYFSPSPRFLAYWERNTGSSCASPAEDTLKGINEYYFLDNVEVVAKKRRTSFDTPPISELRLDYLEEWEYANDVSYFNGYGYSHFVDSLNDEYKTPDYHDETNEMSKVGIYNAEKELEEKRGRLGNAGDVLTASEVVKSVFHRYNIPYAYWVYNVVPKGGYNKDSALVIDHEYLHGINVEKMTNFKELVITSDPKKRDVVEVGDQNVFWEFKRFAYENKGAHAMFYNGFLSLQVIEPAYNIDLAGDIFVRRMKEMFGQTCDDILVRPNKPNYIACFIPQENDKSETGIVPDLSYPTSTRRYTSVQGYTISKQFYSPDYSAAPPAEKDYRRTLLWNPRVRATDGRLAIDFYNSTDCNFFDITVEGRSGDTYYCNSEIFSSAGVCDTMPANLPDTVAVNAISGLAGELLEKAKRMSKVQDSIAQRKRMKEYENAEIYYSQKRYSLALPHYIELATSGYPAAFYRIGLCYMHGYSLKKNPALAFDFMKKGAEKEYPQAQYELALMFRHGHGCEVNEDASIYWFEKAIENGENNAMLELGKLYMESEEMCDTVRGAALLHSSAKLGNAEALYRYAIYMQAAGLENDSLLGTAHTCLTNSALKKYGDAMLYMMRYEHNAANYTAAYHWAHELYLQKNHYGMRYVADCLLEGRTVRRNKKLAKDIYRDAARLGNSEAKRILKEW